MMELLNFTFFAALYFLHYDHIEIQYPFYQIEG